MPLFNGSTQGIVPAALGRVGNWFCGKQHPVILAAIGIHLFIDNGIYGHRAGRERFQTVDHSNFGTKESIRVGLRLLLVLLSLTLGQSALSCLLALSDTFWPVNRNRFGIECRRE